MSHRDKDRARRRARPVAAAISGIAIGVSGLGLAALPASAASASPESAPAVNPANPANGAGQHAVTLITGDVVHVTDIGGGQQTVDVTTAKPGAGVKTLQVGKDLHVLPDAAQPYIASGALDPDLFNVSLLIRDGYDDASVKNTPVILEMSKLQTMSKPLPGLGIGQALPSIGGAAASASHADAAQTWASLTAKKPAAMSLKAASAFTGGISAIHLDGKVKASLDGSVPWIGAPEAWAAGYTGAGVTVAVLDSGYDATHPDLAGRVSADSKSFVPGEEVGTDVVGHGTHVSSTIAGTGAASGGTYRGVADGAQLLEGKVLDADGYGQDSWVISGMEWAAHNAPIVSMSLGSPQPSGGDDLMSKALDDLSKETGALFVVAAGNATDPETIGAPGAAASALTVGSVDDPSGRLSWFSSQGPLAFTGNMKPDIAGPGNNITAARSAQSPGSGSYVSMSGTSMATPHVAGAAAIVKQQHPEYTSAQLRAALTSSARDVNLTSYQMGAGAVNVANAMTAQVVASGSGDFGMVKWGEAAQKVTRKVHYTNRGDAAVTVSLKITLADTTPGAGGGGGIGIGQFAASDGVLSLDTDTLDIPAGETRSVTVTADQGAVPAGRQLSGALVASVAGKAAARTALGIIKEAERYNLTLDATGFDGKPIDAVAWLWNPKVQNFMTIGVSGHTTVRLPAGTYTVMSYLDVHRTPDSEVSALVGSPSVDLTKDVSVALDARTTKPVTVDVGVKDLQTRAGRLDFNVDGFAGSAMKPLVVDDFYAQPMNPAAGQNFTSTARWRLQRPELSVTADNLKLDVIHQVGSIDLDGEFRAPAVDAGAGTTADFAKVDARGKVAVITRSDAISMNAQAHNALDAGAKLVILANNADSEMSESLSNPDYSAVGIPVAGISGVQGRELLAQLHSHPTSIAAVGAPTADEIWDIARNTKDGIPADLTYKPAKLARIDTTYAGQKGQLVGEYRWDFVPGGSIYGVGYEIPTTTGLTRTEWVNTDNVIWYQTAEDVDSTWMARDMRRTLEPGSKTKLSYFDGVARPSIGPGFWAPFRDGDGMQINIAPFADGGSPDHTGTADLYGSKPHISQYNEVYVDGALNRTSTSQTLTPWGLTDGKHRIKVVTKADQDGMLLPGSTSTRTQWEFDVTTKASDRTRPMLPMMSAFYDVARDPQGLAGAKRGKGTPVALDLQLAHVKGAVGSAAIEDARVEARTAGGDWVSVPVIVKSRDTSGPGEPSTTMFSQGRAFLAVYGASVPVPDAGGWVDLRVTGKDAAGNTFSQEITRAFQAAPANGVK